LALASAMALAMVMPTMKTPWADIAPDASRLSDASGAKTVLTLCTGGTLGTAMQEAGGAGFLSHVSYVSDDDGCPLFPLSDSQAASNLRDADAATFLAHDTASVALLGNVQSYDASELTPYQLNVASKSTGLSKEALAASAWHRLVPQRVHYADPRLGVESWVAATEYAEATPNPLAATNSELLRKLSSKQAELNLFASLLEGVPSDELLSSEVLGVDQLGFDLRVETVGNAAAGGAVRRIGFKLPPQNLEEALSYFVKLFQESWERSEGYLE